MNGALTLAEPKKKAPEFGVVRAGLLADLVITPENPLQNFKTLYGNGALFRNEKTGREDWKGGVKLSCEGMGMIAAQRFGDRSTRATLAAK